jgi:hypothetical protein
MVTRRSNFFSFVLSLAVHTKASTAAAVGLLAAVAFSSPAHAETFSLALLDAGADFTVGGLRFDNFVFDSLGSRNVDPNFINITSTETLPGFVVSGGMVGDGVTLQFDYTVVAVGDEKIGGALVWLTDFIAIPEAEIEVVMKEDSGLFREIRAQVFSPPPPLDFLADSDSIIPFATALAIRSELTQDARGTGGVVATGSYANLFFVVPEPGAAALGLAALSTVAVLARTRKSRS